MIFAIRIAEETMGTGFWLFLGLFAFVIFMVLLAHWLKGQPAPTTGQWKGNEYVDAPTIAGYLVDPDTLLPYIFVTIHAINKYGDRWSIDGKYPYKATADELCKIKLIRSGTGFRAYGTQDIEGKWLPCR